MFNLNQIVKGKAAGTFVIVGMRTVGREEGAQVKPVNPADHAQVGGGEFFLPFSALAAL